MSPERLWRISAALRRRGFKRLALLVKKINSTLYHNSLAPGVQFSPDVRFGHHGFGTMIHANVVIGRRVKIWHNVTLAVQASTGDPQKILVEDDVIIGANAVVVTPRNSSVRIGKGARIGAGAVVTKDVPPGATVVGAPVRVIIHGDDGRSLQDGSDARGGEHEGTRTADGGFEDADALGAAGNVFDALDEDS
jgi:serine O-acetyltransferase